MSADIAARVERLVSRLREIRKIRGYSQHELAARSGLDRNQIANIEIGRRQEIRLSEVLLLADALDVDLADLLSPEPLSLVTKVTVV